MLVLLFFRKHEVQFTLQKDNNGVAIDDFAIKLEDGQAQFFIAGNTNAYERHSAAPKETILSMYKPNRRRSTLPDRSSAGKNLAGVPKNNPLLAPINGSLNAEAEALQEPQLHARPLVFPKA